MQSLEKELQRIEIELRRVAGLPSISGGAPAAAEWSLERIYEIVANWTPGGADLSSIGSDLLPSVDDTYDLGSSDHRWQNVYVSDLLALGDDDNDKVVRFSTFLISPSETYLKMEFNGGASFWFHATDTLNGFPNDLYSYGFRVFPATDDTGSLGIAGKTWGDIYATLPTSDPGTHDNRLYVDAGVVMVSS